MACPTMEDSTTDLASAGATHIGIAKAAAKAIDCLDIWCDKRANMEGHLPKHNLP
jgi:hypothetical protein